MKGISNVWIQLPGREKVTNEVRWESAQKGRLYAVTIDQDGIVEQRSFDGKLWYGLTRRNGALLGSIIHDPASVDVADMEAQLVTESAGVYYPKVMDTIARPLNFNGGRSLPDLLLENENFLTIVQNGSEFEVRQAKTAPDSARFPEKTRLILHGKYFYPVEIESTVKDVATQALVITTCLVDGYVDFQNAYLPTQIETTTKTVGKDGSERTVGKQTVALSYGSKELSQSDFVIQFPPGTQVVDDTKPQGSQQSVVQPPGTTNWAPIAILTLLVAGIVTVIVARRNRQ